MTTESLLTASAVLNQLALAGVRELFFAPGSRSAPLVYALDQRLAGDLRAHVRLDERSAGFHALGAARSTGVPAVVVTTSGTAVGNLLPAVLEADHAQVPLILLTADRPPELRGSGANQTTRQPGIFGDHVRACVDLHLPGDSTPELAPQDPGTLDRAVQQALAPALAALTGDDGAPAGPIHLNVAFREPLQPAADSANAGGKDSDGEDTDRLPPSALTMRPLHALDLTDQDRETLHNVGDRLPERRTVILAGDGAGADAATVARTLNLPLLAEPSSGARHGEAAVAAYRLLLDGQLAQSIERVLLIGRPTLSRPVTALLAREDLETAAWQPAAVAWYLPGRRREKVLGTLDHVLEFTGRGAHDWARAWKHLGRRALEAVTEELELETARHSGHLPGLVAAREVWNQCVVDGTALIAGSSNPIRDLDLVAASREDSQTQPEEPGPERLEPARAVAVIANRGVAGIDGTVATAAGVSLATGQPVRALTGDLTFLHDAGSLLRLGSEQQPDVQVVVVDDRGGGIFTTLEHGALAELPRWSSTVERFFGTQPDVDLPGLCRAYGVNVVEVDRVTELRAALVTPPRGVSVVVVRASRRGLRELHARIRTRLGAL